MNPTGPEARDSDQRPSAIWRPIADLEGIWQAERETMRVPSRAVALRLADGRLGIYSPIRGPGSEAHRALTDVGRPTILIAPNHFHNLGLREYASRLFSAQSLRRVVVAPHIVREREAPTKLTG